MPLVLHIIQQTSLLSYHIKHDRVDKLSKYIYTKTIYLHIFKKNP